MERLWTPWRMEYVADANQGDSCLFCDALGADDEAAWVLQRGEQSFVMLNAYPYNTGHVMVAPVRHAGELHQLSADERADLMELTSAAIDAIRSAMGPQGFNVGMNLGEVAGAGVPGHLHVHIVPRWAGDTNFMPVVGDTKVLPEMLAQTYAKLRPGFSAN